MILLQNFKKLDTLKGIWYDLKKIKKIYYKIERNKVIRKYLINNKIRKLQLGSNISQIDGWLSSDLIPTNKKCIYLDVTVKFPFKNAEIDYIYCEHLIEHLNWEDGIKMLQESFRVLRPGGVIRIATPDLKAIINLYDENNPLAKAYIKWVKDMFIKWVNSYNPGFVINTLFRNWNHQFLYDEDTIKIALQNAGFSDIKRVMYYQSDDSNLHNLEQHDKNVGNFEMIVFETMIYEARKK